MIENSVKKYLESPDIKALAKSTQDLYGYALNHVKKWTSLHCPADRDCIEFLSENMLHFTEYLTMKKISGKSVQQYVTCIKLFLKHCGQRVDFTYKISNEMRQVNKKKHLDRWFTERDVELCLSEGFSNNPEFKTILWLLVETGARVGEISNITEDDINLEEGYVNIQGKTEPRPVFFSPHTKEMLEAILSRKTLFPVTDKIFPEVAKIKAAITDMLHQFGLKNGGDGRGPHTFRHYCATKLFYDGEMKIEDIAYLLGDKVDTIRERYLHPTPRMLRKRVERAMGWMVCEKLAIRPT